ncbi:radical SAM protein [Thermodesulforhabdus norvegica]|uniref:FeMo cofactor biosynthesis protein NifB n=1 Tax=Thermodesulforhabdus norvegica TaxID=39841 RepID=A0A1I4UJC5_9BACT|nr:radical SAM protein [Thermodesulforhabdus norvegica]SFM88823.1 nitrogen fixation protein NifB [Thermodesulforhabdus norvegica]
MRKGVTDMNLSVNHPCFDEKAHRSVGRVHLPVAPKCNVLCGYCDRRFSCVNENRPGLYRKLLEPGETVEYLSAKIEAEPRIRVVGIAGPGEPLTNDETFTTLELIRRAFPHLELCVATNGLLLPNSIDLLAELGVHYITVTVNTISPETASKIYLWALKGNVKLTGVEAGLFVVSRQIEGIRRAVEKGMRVKVNTVLIPKLNAGEITEIARAVRGAGAHIMNIIGMLPLGAFKTMRPPGEGELRRIRKAAASIMPQFLLCRRCRADAWGIPAEEEMGYRGRYLPAEGGNSWVSTG